MLYILCEIYGDVAKDSIVHTLEWSIYKSGRQVQCTPVAEILASLEALEGLCRFCQAAETFRKRRVNACILVDTNNLKCFVTIPLNSVHSFVCAVTTFYLCHF